MNTEPQIIIGEREGWGQTQPFGISIEDQRQHIYIIGKTGSGKSTLLRNLIIQHIKLGHGVGVIDPHGDLAEELLNHIPPKRADHLTYFNPGDNALDFIAEMEKSSIHAAALKAIEWFGLDPEAMTGDKAEQPKEAPKTNGAPKPAVSKPAAPAEPSTPNTPLKFRLDKLERNHPYLTERGLTQETIIDFGIGFCAKGTMANRIAIPIHTVKGEVVAYAGRHPGEPDANTPKYKLPQGFRKSQELFNIDRAVKESTDKPLAIVEGFFDCMKLHQLGHRKVVALMGSTLSSAQEELLRTHITPKSQIIVMLDEDDAGRVGREDIAVRLSKFAFVKVHGFEEDGMQPESLTKEQLQEIVGGVL